MGRRSGPDKFPFRLHASGQWCKTIRGRDYNFGTDRDADLTEYVRVKPTGKAAGNRGFRTRTR